MGWIGVIVGQVTLAEQQFDERFGFEIDQAKFDDWPVELKGAGELKSSCSDQEVTGYESQEQAGMDCTTVADKTSA